MTETQPQTNDTYAIAAILIVGALTLLRLAVVAATPLNLGPDEAQYWSWAQNPDWGYFSKPPLIAWLIAGATALCGDGEACVRAPSVLLYALASVFVFLLARDLYGRRAAFWSAILFATLPAVFLSSALITTDVPLLAAWAAALWALNCAVQTNSLRRAAILGSAVGIGLLAKYAMAYFVLCAGLAAIFDRDLRGFVLSARGLLSGAIALLFIAPNLIWNAAHQFATFSHTAANANWGGELFNPGKLGDFLFSQLGVFGPLLAAIFIYGLAAGWWRGGDETARKDRFLLAFALPILAIAVAQAFISRANANWAAPAYVGALVLTTAWCLRRSWPAIPIASFALHTLLGLILYALALSPALIEAAGQANSFKRLRGWDEIGYAVRTRAMTAPEPYTAILVNDRLDMAELLYYARPLPAPLAMWDADATPENQYELMNPLTPELARHVLLVTKFADPAPILARFADAKPAGTIAAPIGGGRTRVFHLFDLRGFR